nr:DUF1003 domain-containing protein [Micromonospora sp. DSM 115978]
MTFSTAAAGRVRRRNSSSVRLDVPVSGRTLLPRPDTEAFARIAELIARFIGTARFLVIQTVVVLIWIALNIAMPFMRWDPYPFILLNLAFSTQAAYAAPLILLAQNRQDDRDRASLTEDRAAAVRMREDTEFLAREVAALRLGVADAATRQYVRGELTHQFDALRGDLDQMIRSAVQTAVAGGGTGSALLAAAGTGSATAGGATAAGSHGRKERGGRQSPVNDPTSAANGGRPY